MGGDTNIEQPNVPSTGGGVSDWISNLPRVFQMQKELAPQEAQATIDLYNQYARPYGQAMKIAQQYLYPNTSALQEQIAGQALQGMQGGIPSYLKDQYMNSMNAYLGNNVRSPIGADYASRGLMQQKEDWRRYYQNLGLTVAGRQPLVQAGMPQTTNYMSGFTPGMIMGNQTQNYATQGSIYGKQLDNPQMATPLGQFGNTIGQLGQMGSSLAGFGAQLFGMGGTSMPIAF